MPDPLRLGYEVARLGVRIGVGAARLPFRLIGGLLGHDGHDPVDFKSAPRREVAPDPEPAPRPQPVPRPRAEIELEPEEPEHIEVETELVAEFAEPGAEDGAGAEIHVDEPWDGYDAMKAADIKDRLTAATPEEAAVVQLYESMKRKRRTVLDAVERRLANAR